MKLADFLNTETMMTPAESPTPLRGQGGGLGDVLPAMIEGEAPAALSEGEFVVPADVVSLLGDGSSEAGARILNGLIEKIRVSKQGNNKQQKSSADVLGSK